MNNHRLRRPASAVAAMTLALAWGGAPMAAAAGPTISLDRAVVAPGEPVIVTLAGFTGSSITVAVCGNLAKRGSADCNMAASTSEDIDRRSETTLTQMFVAPPPATCPCLVRASSTSHHEFAVTAIELVGHPTGPVVDPEPGPLIELDVDAARAGGGFVGWGRAALGGPTSYRVTVSVRNLTTEVLSGVVVSGSAVRGGNTDAVPLGLLPPGPIGPGQRWTTTVDAELPAPVLGRYVWQVTAAGAGAPVKAQYEVRQVPVLLLLLVSVLVVDVSVVVRRSLRRRRETGARNGDQAGARRSLGGQAAAAAGP